MIRSATCSALSSAKSLLTLVSLLLCLLVPLAAASVTDVSTTAADNTHLGIGTPVDIVVTFDADYDLDVSGGQPTLTLSGTSGATAFYTGIGGKYSALSFRYTVHVNDVFTLDATAMHLNGAILDHSTTAPGLTATLAAHNVAIQGNRSGIIGITAPAGTYGAGANVPITVTFGSTLGATSSGTTSTLDLNSGGVATFTSYQAGTANALYTYHVTAGENAVKLNVIGFNLNSATLNDGTNPVLTDVPASNAVGSLNAGQTVIIDTTPPPTVTGVSTTKAAGSYSVGTVIPFTVIFSAAVTVTGTPTLGLSDGKSATYTGANSSTQLAFSYTVTANDTTGGSALALTTLFLSGGTIKDTYSANAVLTLPTTVLNNALIIDTASPTVSIAATPASVAVISPVQPVDLIITFNEPVSGLTNLTVVNGTYTVTASGAAPTATWNARITATGGDVSVQVAANQATDAAGNGNTASNTKLLTFDNTSPTTGLTTGAAICGPNQPITVSATFATAVTDFTAAGITVANGATPTGLSTTNGGTTWTFNVQATGPGALSLTIAAGAAHDNAGNPCIASNTLSVPFDGMAPTVQVTPNGITTNLVPVFALHFNESVTGLAANGLAIANGSAAAPSGTGADYTATVTPTGTAVTVGANSIGSTSIFVTAPAPTTILAGAPVVIGGTTYVLASDAAIGSSPAAVNLRSGLVAAAAVGAPLYTVPVAVACAVSANAAKDAALNGNTASATATITYDPIAPLATVTAAATTAYNVPVLFTVHLTKSVQAFPATALTIGNGSASTPALISSGPGGVDYQISVTPGGNGQVTCLLPAGKVFDSAGNANLASNTAATAYTFTTNPTTTLSKPATASAVGPTRPLEVTIRFSETVTGFVGTDLTIVHGTLTSGPTLQSAATAPSVYTALITADGNGSLDVSVPAGAATDIGNNGNLLSNTLTTTFDGTIPTVTSLTTNLATIGPSQSATVTAVFSSAVQGFDDATNIVVTNGSVTANPTTSDNRTYLFVVHAAGPADLTIRVNANAAQDAITGNANSQSVVRTITFDGTAPTAAVVTPNGTLTNGALVFALHFNEAVTGLTATGLSIANGAATAAPTGSGTDYTVTATPTPTASSVGSTPAGSTTISVTGTQATTLLANTALAMGGTTYVNATDAAIGSSSPVTITLKAPLVATVPTGTAIYSAPVVVGCAIKAGAAQDAALNANTASATATITYDPIAPIATVTAAASNAYNVPVIFNLHLSKAVQPFTASALTITNGSATTPMLVSSGPGGVDYQIAVTPAANGAVTCLLAAGKVTDNAGNANQTASQDTSTYTFTTNPTTTLSKPATASFVGARPLEVTISFSETVTGFAAGDLTILNGTRTSGPTLKSAATAPSVYTALITANGAGPLTVTVPANAAQDIGNHGNLSATLAVPYDGTNPTVTSLTANLATIGPGQSATVTAVFSSAVQGFTDATNITVTNGTVTANPTTTDNRSFAFVVKATGPADLTIRVNANAAQDAITGNASQQSAVTSVTFDGAAPLVTVNPTGNLTNVAPVFSLHFSEAVNGVAVSDLTLVNGTASTVQGSGTDYTVTVTPAPTAVTVAATPINTSSIFVSAATPATLQPFTPIEIGGVTYVTTNAAALVLTTASARIDLATPLIAAIPVGTAIFAAPVAVGCQVKADATTDLFNNPNTASAIATQTYDPIAPLVLITATTPNSGSSPVFFNLRVSKPVQNLTATDLTVINGTVFSVILQSDGLDYQIAIIPANVGPVTCRLAAGSVTDNVGNPNQASNTATITYDNRALTVAIASTQPSPSNSATLAFTVGFSKPLVAGDFNLTDLLVVNGTAISGQDAGDHQHFIIQVTPTADGPVSLQVVDGSVADQYGVVYRVASTDIASVTSDRTAPVITALAVTNATGTYGAGSNVVIAATISEVVTVAGPGPGRPAIPLNSSATAAATWANGSGTALLNFQYTIAAGDAANPLALGRSGTAAAPLALNGTTITDAAGNTVSLILPALTGGVATIDTSGPTVTGVDSTLVNGVYGAGQVVPIVIHFTEAVQVTGAPTLSLKTGSTDTTISYTSGSGSNTLTFTYTIGTGQTSSDLDYDGVNALALSGGTITDLFGNPAIITLPANNSGFSLAGTRTLVVNTTDTSIPNVTTTAFTTPAGTYVYGGSTLGTIGMTVTFDRAVGVVGTPFLVMNDIATGHTTPKATYVSGSGTNVLAFTYTIAQTDSTPLLGYANTAALRTTSSDTITNVTVPANLTLAAPGTPGSLELSAVIAINPTGSATGKPPATALPAASGSAASCGLGSGIAAVFAALGLLGLRRRRLLRR